ncbi:unnamed protein product [Caenorhabditis brenneri]
MVIFSALLYIPMLISIHKLKHLQSVKLNHPQRFVFWQLSAISIEKVLALIVYCKTDDNKYYDMPILLMKAMDAIFLPSVIQLSYLGCNKRTFDSLTLSFKLRKLFRIFFCGCAKDSTYEQQLENQVCPMASTRF